MKRLILFILAMFCLASVEAQSDLPKSKRDSLMAVIARPTHDTALAAAYVDLSTLLAYSDWDTVFVLCNAAISIAEKGLQDKDPKVVRSFNRTLSNALVNLGYVNNYRGKNDQALEGNWRSLKIKEQLGDKNGIATLYLNIGTIYYDMGDIPSALEYFSKSARIHEELDDLIGMAYAYNNMGAVHLEQQDLKAALSYFEQTRQICEQSGDSPGLAMAHDNIAQIMIKDPADTTALRHYTKALKLREAMDDREGIALSLSNISRVYEMKGELDTAMSQLKQALSLQEKIGDKQGIAMSCIRMAGIAMKLGPKGHQDAVSFAKRGLTLAEELGDPYEMSGAAEILSDVYKAKGQYKEAFEMYELHITMRDSIYNEENRREVMRQQMQYDYDKKESLLAAEQEKKDAIATEQLRRREIYLAAAAAITFLLGIMSLMAFFAYRSKAKVNTLLEKKNHLIEEQKKEITDSIRYAENIQRALLPPAEVLRAVFPESFILHRPKDIVSGDFYWIHDLPDRVYFAVVDCTGHGVPGAFMSFIGTSALNRAVTDLQLVLPSDILSSLSDQVSAMLRSGQGADVKDGMDLALCCYFKEKKELHYAGAYNPLWVMRNGEMEIVKADKHPVGNLSSHRPFTDHSIRVAPGDSVYLFSDGFADQFGGKDDKKIGTGKFRSTLVSMKDTPLRDQGAALTAFFDNWKGTAEQVDDVCVMGVRF